MLACLLHDIAMVGLIGGDHGYWGAQLIAPYVDEEVAFAVRYHQALRFFPDPAVGYEYPQAYIDIFGKDYKPEPYIYADYEYARAHKWYGMARMITLNDLYAFDPNYHGRSGGVHGYRRPPFPAAEGRFGFRQFSRRPYVAGDDLAEEFSLRQGCSS